MATTPAPGTGAPAVLALDVGTSSCRASLYTVQGDRVADVKAGQVGYAPRTTADGGAELDPATLFDQLCAAIDPVALAADAYTVVAVATSTFWHSLMGIDARGRPVTPVYLWMDARSRADAVTLQSRLDQDRVHGRTGCLLHWSYWPAKLVWLRRARPELFGAAYRWVSFAEYAQQRLLGGGGVSVSMASGTGLLDQHTCDWDDEVLGAVGVAPERLGALTSLEPVASSLAATFSERWPALRGVPWLPAVGDGAASNLGAGCATRDRFALMIGTSAAERVIWRPDTEFTIPMETWCYRVDRQRVVMGGAMNDGGSLVEWLASSLRLPALDEVESAVARLEPDGHGLTVLPLWGGERSPGWAPDARGAIVGLRLHSGPADIFRAALEAVALRFRIVDAALRQVVPEVREVVATGGALLHAPVWLQIIADVLGRPVTASGELQASSRGAALLAMESLGRLEQPIEAVVPSATRVYTPIAGHTERYAAAAVRQAHLYDLLIGQAPPATRT